MSWIENKIFFLPPLLSLAKFESQKRHNFDNQSDLVWVIHVSNKLDMFFLVKETLSNNENTIISKRSRRINGSVTVERLATVDQLIHCFLLLFCTLLEPWCFLSVKQLLLVFFKLYIRFLFYKHLAMLIYFYLAFFCMTQKP